MTIILNCSNLKAGGGLQVADSICGLLYRFPHFRFIVVLSSYLNRTAERIKEYDNVETYVYDIPDSFRSIVMGKDKFLDGLVRDKHVDAVLTVFGPSRWRPSVPHLSGFALPQLVIPESPYFSRMNMRERMMWRFWCAVRQWSLKRSADIFWTENPYISERLEKIMGGKPVHTVSNYYNQIFDQYDLWNRDVHLPTFDGTTMLTVSSTAGHKNLGIMVPVAEYMEKTYPDFQFRFVLTCEEAPFEFPEQLRHHFMFVGKVDVSECPNLYEKANIMFMPSLLECFTATYPEAMQMGVPIVTTDLEFARGLCGDAACYYSAIDAQAAAEAIYRVATDNEYAQKLVENGRKQLLKFDNYEQRAEKLMGILQEIAD